MNNNVFSVIQRQLYMLAILMVILSLLLVGLLVSCNSIPSSQLRHESIKQFLNIESPQVLIYRPRLSVRSPGLLIGATDPGPALSDLAGIGNPLRTFVPQFIVTATLPETTSLAEVNQETLAELRSLDPAEPVVFFFSGGWYLDYQRFPPNLQDYQLSFSIIGKLVPRGLILSGGGTLSLPKASWTASCYYVGSRHTLETWRANQGALLQKEMRNGLNVCQDKLGVDFKKAMLNAQ